MSLFLRMKPGMRILFLMLIVVGALASVAVVRKRSLPRSQAVAKTSPSRDVALDSFVPSGIPVTLSSVVASVPLSDDGKLEGPATLRVSLTGAEKLTSVNLVAFGFNANGDLTTVKGWVRNLEQSGGEPAALTLDLNRRILPDEKYVLAVERSNGLNAAQADFVNMSQAVVAGVRKQVAPAVVAQRSEGNTHDEAGADLCNNALRRSMSLAKANMGITSLRCDQQERSFTITYGKVKSSK